MNKEDKIFIDSVFKRLSKIQYSELKLKFEKEFNEKIEIETKYSNDLNIEGRTERLEYIKNINNDQLIEIKSVIDSLKDSNYIFDIKDIDRLNTFTKRINYLLKSTSSANKGMADQMNNVFHGAVNDGEILNIYDFFNECKKSKTWAEFEKNSTLHVNFFEDSIKWKLIYVYSNIKNCQDKENFPLYYAAWQIIAEKCFEVKKMDYDSFCDYYRNLNFLDNPKLLQFSCYYYLLRLALRSDEDYKAFIINKEENIRINILNEIREDEVDELNKFKTEINTKNMLLNHNFFIIEINELSDVFSRIESSTEFNFTLNTNEADTEDVNMKNGNVIIASISDKIYYKFTIIEIRDSQIRLRKEFEIQKTIGYKIGVVGVFKKLTEEDYIQICSKIFKEYNYNNVNEINNHLTEPESPYNTFKGSLNQILYGPPGTGKTYNSINKALEIIDSKIDLKQKRSIIKSEYEKFKKNGQVLFTTFHQSLSYEDFIEGIKPQEPIVGESLKYEIQAGIFKIACARAGFLCQKKYNEINKKEVTIYKFDDLYNAFTEFIQKEIDKGIFPTFTTITGKSVEIFEINTQGSIRARAKGSITNKVAPLTQENIEKLYNKYNSIDEIEALDVVKETVGISPRITEFYAVFKGIKEFETIYKAESSIIEEVAYSEISDDNEKIKKFDAGIYNEAIINVGHEAERVVLIIDEINRGNVSQIFGELITLIEDDKRLGRSESLEAILAYSKSNFGVPSNLHIVGTMNTADRSVEALDTALRRRFIFEEMPPRYHLEGLKYKLEGIDGFEILKTINNRIEKLLDKNHQIGHSYFILKDGEKANEKLINSFYKNIIPLLQEYFFGDFGKIGLVLGEGFVRLKTWTDSSILFTNFEHENREDLIAKETYEIIDYRNLHEEYKIKNIVMTFENAIKLLMNQSID
jgi:hypothetical protein